MFATWHTPGHGDRHDAAGFAAAAGSEDPVRAAVDVLWQVMRRPDTLAAIELYVAARTTPELRVALAELERAHTERILTVAAMTLVDAAGHPSFRPAVRTVIDAVQGAVLRDVVGADAALLEAQRRLLVDLARVLLAHADAHDDASPAT